MAIHPYPRTHRSPVGGTSSKNVGTAAAWSAIGIGRTRTIRFFGTTNSTPEDHPARVKLFIIIDDSSPPGQIPNPKPPYHRTPYPEPFLPSPVTRHPSPVTRHPSFLIPHSSFLIPHSSFLKPPTSSEPHPQHPPPTTFQPTPTPDESDD